MNSFFKMAFELLSQIFYNIVHWLVSIVYGFVKVFVTGWSEYFTIFMSYFKNFGIGGKILAIILMLIIVAVPVAIIYLIIRKLIMRSHLKHDKADNATLYKEIGRLNRQVLDLIDEKNRILALKVNSMGANEPLPYMGASALVDGDEATTGVAVAAGAAGAVAGEIKGGNITAMISTESGGIDPNAIRFPMLAKVDEKYADYVRPQFDETISLQAVVENYRLFAASQMGLYYTPEIVRRFVAGMASSKLLILEGISGTGKTSLPYSFSRYLDNPATIVSVQPSYRDRTEILGYFNEFSKRFNETEFLRALYEANYREDPNLIVLDEMNLARIEYYFAEMLSVLEMPSHDEWVLSLVPTQWPKDPVKLFDGKIQVTDNIWFIGTANNDDSTFTITDKVYDRAIPIELNERADAFECPKQPKCYVSAAHLQVLFDRAKQDYPISDETLEKMRLLNEYLMTRFKLAFGNRIIKQMYDFIPVYVACGGDEIGGMDYIIARKVLKKFESMNVGFVRDEIKGLILYIEKVFGKRAMPDSIAYLTRIQNLY
ncbi:MAG: hypothetical protein Q4B73_01315 [Lachnospiraceae bacterium]|nr:hypothetical protein [Lachnospiraceae bacterium]